MILLPSYSLDWRYSTCLRFLLESDRFEYNDLSSNYDVIFWESGEFSLSILMSIGLYLEIISVCETLNIIDFSGVLSSSFLSWWLSYYFFICSYLILFYNLIYWIYLSNCSFISILLYSIYLISASRSASMGLWTLIYCSFCSVFFFDIELRLCRHGFSLITMIFGGSWTLMHSPCWSVCKFYAMFKLVET